MKTFFYKLFAVCLIFGATATSLSAQSPFTKESHVIHLGLGLGGYSFSGYSSTPVFSVAYDQGIIDDLGIGNLGIGGAIGVKHYTYKPSFSDTKYSYNRIFIGARAHYHFHFVNSDNFDFYAGVMAGAFFWTGDTDFGGLGYSTSVSPGAFAGINYFFNDTFGVYAEAGYGLGLLNGGLSINF